MNKLLVSAVLSVGLALAASAAGPETWTVYPDDHVPVKDGASVGTEAMTPARQLAYAVQQAVALSTIIIKPGVYDLGAGLEAVNPKDSQGKAYLFVENKTLFFRGEDATHWSEKTPAQETVLKGGPDGRIVYAYAGAGRASVFRNLTFEGGTAESGKHGGAIYFSGTEFILPYERGYASNCVFRGNSATHGGGTFDVNVYDSFFTNNLAIGGGGGASGTSMNTNNSTKRMHTNDFVRCVFVDNRSQGAVSGGGALFLDTAGRVVDCKFRENRTTGTTGGGVFVKATGSSSEIVNCTFDGNVSVSGGGAISCAGSGAGLLPPVVGCTFTANSGGTGGAIYADVGVSELASSAFSNNVARSGSGGAVYTKRTDVLTNCVFTGNSAPLYSAGAYCASASAIGLLRDCTFTENNAGQGGGALWVGADQGELANCRFERNTAGTAGAISFTSAFGTMTNCTFAGNSAKNDNAAFVASGYARVVDCTFRDNASGGNCAGIRATEAASAGVVENCVFDNNTNRFANVGSHIRFASQVTGCTFSGYGDMFATAYDRCVFSGCRFDYDDYGGGMIVFDTMTGAGHLRNCLFSGNAVHIYIKNATGSAVEIANCTFVSNSVLQSVNVSTKGPADGYLLYSFRGGTDPVSQKQYPSTNVVVNCLFADNTRHGARNDVNFYITDNNVPSPSVNVLSNCLWGVASFVRNPTVQGANVPNAEPKFLPADPAHPELPQYLIARGSKARNAGCLLPWMTADAIDLAGSPRVAETAPDIGCYECGLLSTGTLLLFR